MDPLSFKEFIFIRTDSSRFFGTLHSKEMPELLFFIFGTGRFSALLVISVSDMEMVSSVILLSKLLSCPDPLYKTSKSIIMITESTIAKSAF